MNNDAARIITLNNFQTNYTMHGKFFISILLSFIPLLVGCNSDESLLKENNSLNQTDASQNSRKKIIESIDSLNCIYTPYETRGFWDNVSKKAFVMAADEAGRHAGRHAGKWAGAAAGSLTGNPLVSALGYVGGRQIGGLVGYALATAAAELIIDKYGSCVVSEGKMKLKACYSFKPSRIHVFDYTFNNEEEILRCDSIGFYHNYAMYKINQSKSQYLGGDDIDFDKMYFDVLSSLEDRGIDVQLFLTDEMLKNDFLRIAISLGKSAYGNLESNSDLSFLFDMLRNTLVDSCQIPEELTEDFYEFSYMIIKGCCELNQEQLFKYAESLNTLIMDSDADELDKAEMLFSSMAIINSALCWEE